MASRTILHHAALKITPPPRTLRESREIYRSLRKFGEIDLYRSLRHETSTLEAKEDAIVLFRNEAALRDAFDASPMNVSMPAAQPSPIPSSGHGMTSVTSDPLFSDKFTIEISRREHNHETRIIDQLFTYTQAPYSVNQETPPGTSISFNLRSDMGRTPDANEYRTNLARATGGGWKSWRLEMKQAGIPTWDTIKPASGPVATTPPESSTPRPRTNSASWGRPLDTYDGKSEVLQPAPPKSVSSTISSPTPLPLDPTLQPFRRQRPSQTERTNNSQSMRGSTGWWRNANQVEGRSFQPQSAAPPVVEGVDRSPPKAPSFEVPARSETGSKIATRALNNEPNAPPLISNKGPTINTESIVKTGPDLTSPGVDTPPIVGTKQPKGTNREATSKSTHEHELHKVHEAQKPRKDDVAVPPVSELRSGVKGGSEETSPIKAEFTIDAQGDEAVPTKDGQPEQKSTPGSHPIKAIADSEPAPAKKRWWRLPWER